MRVESRLLDIGCGWGGLIMHAAAHYGVQGVGITLSVPQAEVARQRLREASLNDRCRVEVSDYRDIDHGQQYDKIVSVGMFEHVGEEVLPEYFSRAWSLLQPGGVFLNHGIAYSATYRSWRSGLSRVRRLPYAESGSNGKNEICLSQTRVATEEARTLYNKFAKIATASF